LNVSKITALYDACLLYSAPLRDLLMHLALTDLFYAKWTDAIHDEWIQNVRKDRPELPLAQLERTRQLMNVHVLDCLVTGYEGLIPSLVLPDADDRHVLAAAIHAGASSIVTFNLKDFPAETLRAHGVEAIHPDEFVVSLFQSEPLVVCAAVNRQRANLKNPPKSVAEFLDTLERHGLPKTVALLRQFADDL
jgi:hypothetical protein